MLLSSASIDKLTNIITGYSGLTSKINKSEIDKILEDSGSKDIICTYDECFAEHFDIINNPLYTKTEFKQEKYVKLQLEKLNGTSKIADFITIYFEHIYDYTDEPEEVVVYLNKSFDDDGYSVEKIEESDEYKIYSIDDCLGKQLPPKKKTSDLGINITKIYKLNKNLKGTSFGTFPSST